MTHKFNIWENRRKGQKFVIYLFMKGALGTVALTVIACKLLVGKNVFLQTFFSKLCILCYFLAYGQKAKFFPFHTHWGKYWIFVHKFNFAEKLCKGTNFEF